MTSGRVAGALIAIHAGERLWRTVKYEEVYLKEYDSVAEAVRSLGSYFVIYNTERPHQALGYKTPLDFYVENTGRHDLAQHFLS